VSSPGSLVKAIVVGIGGITGWETSWGSAVVTVVIVELFALTLERSVRLDLQTSKLGRCTPHCLGSFYCIRGDFVIFVCVTCFPINLPSLLCTKDSCAATWKQGLVSIWEAVQYSTKAKVLGLEVAEGTCWPHG
jgi:hypothetical protein